MEEGSDRVKFPKNPRYALEWGGKGKKRSVKKCSRKGRKYKKNMRRKPKSFKAQIEKKNKFDKKKQDHKTQGFGGKERVGNTRMSCARKNSPGSVEKVSQAWKGALTLDREASVGRESLDWAQPSQRGGKGQRQDRVNRQKSRGGYKTHLWEKKTEREQEGGG